MHELFMEQHLITRPVSVVFPYDRRSAVARVSRAASTCDPHNQQTGLLSLLHVIGLHPLLNHSYQPTKLPYQTSNARVTLETHCLKRFRNKMLVRALDSGSLRHL